MRSLIVGNPKLPLAVTDHYGWKDIPHAEQEATMVAELLQSQVLLGSSATKEQILTQMQEAECIHFSTHVSWKLSSLVLSPTEVYCKHLSAYNLIKSVIFRSLNSLLPSDFT